MSKSENIVKIDKMIFGGLGLARTDSGVVFVEGALPGEVVTVEGVDTTGGVPVCKVTRLLEPSIYRRAPLCPCFGVCGGCDWLHIDYNAQVQFKKDAVVECMSRIGKLPCFPEPEIFCSPEYDYRLRAQFKVGSGIAGFFKRKTNEIVGVRNCPLLCQPLNGLLDHLGNNPFDSGNKVVNVRVLAGTDGRLASDPVVGNITGSATEIRVAGKIFALHGNSFFQNNRFLLEQLGMWAHPLVGGDFCVDLYGGTGFFSVFLAAKFRAGLLIECVAEQVEAAQANYQKNGIENFTVKATTAEKLPKLPKKISTLIIDPPRPGLTRTARESIVRLGAEKILYISCNASTQARDLGFFVNKCGYTIEKSAIFDLYPNTNHIESVILLSR